MTPMSKISAMGALKIVDPSKFEATLRREMKRSDGYLAPCAEAMGVSKRQLARWLDEYPDIPRAPAHRPTKG